MSLAAIYCMDLSQYLVIDFSYFSKAGYTHNFTGGCLSQTENSENYCAKF